MSEELERRSTGGSAQDKKAIIKKIDVIISYYGNMIERKNLIFITSNVIDIKERIDKDCEELFESLNIKDWKVNFSVDEEHERLRIWVIFDRSRVDYYLTFVEKDLLKEVLKKAYGIYMTHAHGEIDMIRFLRQSKRDNVIDAFGVNIDCDKETSIIVVVEKNNRKESITMGETG